MPDTPLTWTPVAPLLGGLLAALLLLAHNRKMVPAKYATWLRLAAYLTVAAAFVAETTLLVIADGSTNIGELGVSLAMSTPARIVLIAANVSLFCAATAAWTAEDEPYSPDHEWGLLLPTLASSLVAVAGLVSDRLVASLVLLGAALAVSALAMGARGAGRDKGLRTKDEGRTENRNPRSDDGSPTTNGGSVGPLVSWEDEGIRTQTLLARRVAGGLKHIGLSTLGTGLLMVGAVLISRYTFNLENRSLLQTGLALLASGIVVRAGSMPFAGASGDTVQAAPSAALMMLGAAAPVVLVVGLLMFAPVEGSLAGGAAAGWLGVTGTLLAGLRALGVLLEDRNLMRNGETTSRNADSDLRIATGEANLIAMTVAAATGWALFGVLSGSQSGATGAVLIAANIAFALPILVMGRQWIAVGVASLLGLPPFGGFAGTMLVAGSAANQGGVWLALLLLGSALVAGAWIAYGAANGRTPAAGGPRWREWLTTPAHLLSALLVIVQPVLFVVSPYIIGQLHQWATVPWLTAP